LRASDAPQDPRVALVIIGERDIAAHGWPLSDDVLARAIEAVARHRPRAIGVDIYRDVPVAPGAERLRAVLGAEPNVIAAMKHPDVDQTGVQAPAVLRGTERVGFTDIVVDHGGVVRRGLLYLDDGKVLSESLSLRLALLYLRAQGVVPQPDARIDSHMRLGQVSIRPLEGNDGGYVHADARGYQFLLDFKDARRWIPSVGLTELFAGAFDPTLFRDRIVLIGVGAESVGDHFYIPFSDGSAGSHSVPGVAVHAQVTSQLLRIALDADAPTTTLPKWQEWCWILLWSVAGALLALRMYSPWKLSAAALAGVVVLAALSLFAFAQGLWIPLVPAALAWLAAAATTTAYISNREAIQRVVLMDLFSRHVSREFAEFIWKKRDQFQNGGRPSPERLVATVLFADMKGFTTEAEKQTPEVLLDWLYEYMDAMTQEIARHGGVIRQYAGDGIVSFFGAPVPRVTEAEIDQDARNAVRCALAMEETLRELNRRWRMQGRAAVGMRVGIFTGPMVAGSLGSAQRSEFVIEGDTVNTGARLESFDKELYAPDPDSRPARILIGEPTLERLGTEFETQRIGEFALRGKEQRVSVYRVLGRRALSDESAPLQQNGLREIS
jgi:adenylate cyclase